MKLNYVLVIMLLLSSCFGFESEQQVDLFTEMALLEQEIEELAESQLCLDASEWGFVAFGSKPCGGPWKYIAYSNRINVPAFLAKVKRYNELQQEDNIRSNRFSDCRYVGPPSSLACQGGGGRFWCTIPNFRHFLFFCPEFFTQV
ncbi:hypothetical protein [Algoriphagus sp.]|uniref:hypothetical protein n=1 Tax=Algoriphagus sp. TaxID=1872435 RepID=UPI002621C1A0|nr:hypothetical protein [Algoriphagus sp.]